MLASSRQVNQGMTLHNLYLGNRSTRNAFENIAPTARLKRRGIAEDIEGIYFGLEKRNLTLAPIVSSVENSQKEKEF